MHRAIGDLPRGRGILGLLIDDPRPLRIAAVGEHPRSYGLPPGHPPMASFLVSGRRPRPGAGNLYLTEKQAGTRFDCVDEQPVVILPEWAAIAIENARLYEAAAARRDELEQSSRRLEASRAIAVAVGRERPADRPGAHRQARPRAPAIEALVARVSAVEGLNVDAVLELEPGGPRQDLETTVHRLVLESLTNVAKHARADHARVLVGTGAGRLHVEVADDGHDRGSSSGPGAGGSAAIRAPSWGLRYASPAAARRTAVRGRG